MRALNAPKVPSKLVANTRPFETAGDPYAQLGIVYVHATCPVAATNE